MQKHDHTEIISTVRRQLSTEEAVCSLADLFKVFGDSTRMRILFALLSSELCVCAICELLCMEQSAISHQLKVLKDARLVKNRRDGKTVYYSLADDHVGTMIAQGFDHISESGHTAKGSDLGG